MGRRGLYPTLSNNIFPLDVSHMMDILAYADRVHDILQIADVTGVPAWQLIPLIDELLQNELLTRHD